jgi:hypothetical protein
MKGNLEKQFYLRFKSLLKSKLNGNNLIKAVNTYAVPLLTYSFGVIKWSKTNLQNINIKTRVLFTKFSKHHPKSAIERFNLAVKFNLLKDTQPHYIYKPESCLENDNFCSTLSKFENFLLCERIFINVTTCQNETSC